jgi:hypothetical protein
MFYSKVVNTIIYAVFRALNPAVGSKGLGACWLTPNPRSYGHRVDGSEWSSSAGVFGGPWCATVHGDGDSGQQPIFLNMMTNVPSRWLN